MWSALFTARLRSFTSLPSRRSPEPSPNRPQDGRASLHLASYQGHLDIVQLLLKHGANVTATTAARTLAARRARAGG